MGAVRNVKERKGKEEEREGEGPWRFSKWSAPGGPSPEVGINERKVTGFLWHSWTNNTNGVLQEHISRSFSEQPTSAFQGTTREPKEQRGWQQGQQLPQRCWNGHGGASLH